VSNSGIFYSTADGSSYRHRLALKIHNKMPL